MNKPLPPTDFEAQVRSTVDPLPANPLRKRAMREELLAHLLGAFDEELAFNKSPESATAAAKSRFGNIDAVREQLYQSVPLLERLIFQFLTPREPSMSPILRWIMIGFACFAIGMAIILPALARIKAGEHFTARIVIPISTGVAIAVVGLVSSVYRVVKLSKE